MKVTLTWYEVAMASHVGWMRQLKAMTAGKVDRHGYDGAGWSEHCEGACGEMALAKGLRIYWDGSVDTWAAHELIVRPVDADDSPWVLVTGKAPSYWVRGWMLGSEAKRPEWMQSHGVRPAAYFVPHSALRPVDELRARLSA